MEVIFNKDQNLLMLIHITRSLLSVVPKPQQIPVLLLTRVICGDSSEFLGDSYFIRECTDCLWAWGWGAYLSFEAASLELSGDRWGQSERPAVWTDFQQHGLFPPAVRESENVREESQERLVLSPLSPCRLIVWSEFVMSGIKDSWVWVFGNLTQIHSWAKYVGAFVSVFSLPHYDWIWPL